MVQVNTEEAPPCNEVFIDVVDYGTVGDAHPEEIVVDDVHAPWCNEAYTMVQLSASTSSEGTTSFCIKVDTGAGGNILPLHVFQHIYPNWISPDDLPTGLDHVSTRLTANNESHIPLYGALHGPHFLVARWPWHSTSQGKLLLVCYRHLWSCHPRSSIMQKVSGC